jgi:hypothetical protein
MIRQLTRDDAEKLEALVKTRSNFQSRAVWPDYYWKLLRRLSNPYCAFFGYFVGDSLEAASEFRAMSDGHYAFGPTWTRKGHTLPRIEGARHTSALYELMNHAIDAYHSLGYHIIWTSAPDDPNWIRTTDHVGCPLSDPSRFKREFVGTVQAGCLSGVPQIDVGLLFGHPLEQAQVIIKYADLDPIPVENPGVPGGPPPGKEATPHPMPPPGNVATPHPMPLVGRKS